MKSKPYPRRCAECGEQNVNRVTVEHAVSKKHDGKLYQFSVPDLPVDKCGSCEEVYFTNVSSDFETEALKVQLGLLPAPEIRRLLEKHRLTQRDFARHLRVAEESVSRWLNNLSVQSRALDTLMRLYFAIPKVRELVSSGDSILPRDVAADPTLIVTHPVNIVNLGYEGGAEHPIFGPISKPTLERRNKFKLIV